MISRKRASPCTNAQSVWLMLAKPPARLPMRLDRPSSEDPVGVVAPFARIATPNLPFSRTTATCADLFLFLERRAQADTAMGVCVLTIGPGSPDPPREPRRPAGRVGIEPPGDRSF